MIRLVEEIKKSREYSEMLLTINQEHNSRPIMVSGLCEGAEICLAASIANDCRDRGCLIILPDEKRVHRMSEVLSECGLKCFTYIYRDMMYRNIASSHDGEYERIRTLHALLNVECDVVITTSDAALQFTIPPEKLESSSFIIDINKEYDVEEIVDFLAKNKYKRCDMVDGVGQFSQRGGILDIYAPGEKSPVRIDFFGDSIDSMGYFDIISQRRIENCEKITITPCREVFYSKEEADELIKLISARLRYVKDEYTKNSLKDELSCLEAGIELYCADKYISAIYKEKNCFLDYCNGMQTIAFDYDLIEQRQKAKDTIENENVVALLSKGEISPKIAEYTYNVSKLEDYVFNSSTLITTNFASSFPGKRFSGMFSFSSRQTVSYAGKFELLLEDLKGYMKAKYRVKILCETNSAASYLADRLKENGIDSYVENGTIQKECTVVTDYSKDIPGFELTKERFACLVAAESSIVKKNKSYQKRKSKKDKDLQRIMSYAELDVGDYVVHQVHGIGIYKGINSITIDGITKDYLKIQYAGNDVLHLHCSQLDKISKHIGASSENGTLKLSKMGGSDFAKAKIKAKASAQSMAKELIKLYAERLRRPGFAFPSDDDMQLSFEEAFEYDETDGQITAIEDIKKDMQQPHPMDRLLCGDVGYGKTEVAIRAAFKCAEAGKQVAVLVPTTILAMQHYRTFVSRMRGYPVRIDVISRFKTPKEVGETLRRLKRGETDIIIGTHRLLSKDIEFKDLGLLIIDEEQRFGVSHKEKLKQMAGNVDVLTLSATPIPRTLNMAISGIRDISILDEAPNDRLPVQSFVMEYDDGLIAEAINKELRRGGQVFYLCNRINSMESIKNRIARLVPDAVIETANGQMDKDELSDIWQAMVEGKIDILVSTTIIETGIDIPNANTLIIEHADKLGLSQLHQLRGRVGRSSRRAYAYFTYPKDKCLNEISEKRLEAIRDFTEFGAGFRIAMRDMEIRGAGDLLGAEQHGHMESIGYDLFMKLLNEAVLEEKGEPVKKIPECLIDLNINAYIPEDYIKSSNQRIDAYKKTALIECEEDMRDVYDELTDRYGKMPEYTENLLKVSLLRILGGKCGFSKIEKKGRDINFYPTQFVFADMSRFVALTEGRATIKMGSSAYVSYKSTLGPKSLKDCINLLNNYLSFTKKS